MRTGLFEVIATQNRVTRLNRRQGQSLRHKAEGTKMARHLKINRRMALLVSASVLVGTLVSASTPVGPHEARLRARLKAVVAGGMGDLKISWSASAARLTREERAVLMREILDAPARPVAFA